MDGRSDTGTAPLGNFGPVTITTPGECQIVVTRLFDAPRELVFEAWTKTKHVARWWDPICVFRHLSRDFSACTACLRFRP